MCGKCEADGRGENSLPGPFTPQRQLLPRTSHLKPEIEPHPLHIFQPHYNVRYTVLRWRPLLMWCQSLDNLLQQLDPHLLPLTFLFPSQDSLLMQRKLSPTYLFADRPVCKAAVSRRRCAPPRLKCDVLWCEMLILWLSGGLRSDQHCVLVVWHTVIHIYTSITLLSPFFPFQLSPSVFYSKWWLYTEIEACFTSDMRTWWQIYCMNRQLTNRKNCPFKFLIFINVTLCIKEAKLTQQCMIFGLLFSCLIL